MPNIPIVKIQRKRSCLNEHPPSSFARFRISRNNSVRAHPPPVKGDAQCTQLRAPVLVQSAFQSWQTFIHHTMQQIFLLSKWVETFWNQWYSRNFDTDPCDQTRFSHWLQRLLLLSCCPDPARSISHLVCFAMFRVLLFHVYLAVFYHNSYIFYVPL